MTQEEIIEGNRLIAEFMKFSVTDHNGQLMWFDHIGARDVLYHKSWDWLMPVVEKIRGLRDNVSDNENGLAYSEIDIDIVANGHISGKKEDSYRISIRGKLVYRIMVNSYQHRYETIEVPSIWIYGENAIDTIYSAIIQFITWLNDKK